MCVCVCMCVCGVCLCIVCVCVCVCVRVCVGPAQRHTVLTDSPDMSLVRVKGQDLGLKVP